MGPATPIGQGYFSLLRYRSDPTRDEARNIAVVLVDDQGRFSGLRAAPLSQVSPNLHEQGIVDGLLTSLARRVSNQGRLGLPDLIEWSHQSAQSLLVTTPSPTALVRSGEETLGALYKALVAPRVARSAGSTKGKIIDKVVREFRSRGAIVERSTYLEDFLFDAIIGRRGEQPLVVSCLTFDRIVKDWSPTEKDAGHFLFAAGRLGASSVAVIDVPTSGPPQPAAEAYRRVNSWLHAEAIPIVSSAGVGDFAAELYGEPKQLLLQT